MKEERRLIPEPNDVSVETRKGLQLYGCVAIVICMYFGVRCTLAGTPGAG